MRSRPTTPPFTYLKKKKKCDGDKYFNSNHIINGGYRLSILLSFLFNAMLVHGYYPSELLKSTIISLPKDKTASLSSSSNSGASPGFGRGGGKNCFFQIWKFACRRGVPRVWQRGGEEFFFSDLEICHALC